MKPGFPLIISLIPICCSFLINTRLIAQENNELQLTGKLLTDQRFLLQDGNDWAWNENRLTLNLSKKIGSNSKFYSEIWLRNIGLAAVNSASDLYNKGIVDPLNLEIREAYVQINGFLSDNLDLTVGRQRIAWGTADKLNPTDNLNPYDLEDILDFGRHRGSDAINLMYYLNNDYSLQAVFIPFFQPANMPIGIFSNALNPVMELPPGIVLSGYTDNIILPRFGIGESSIAGFRFKGMVKSIDFSASYVWGFDGLPFNTKNIFNPTESAGEIMVDAEASYFRTHILGVDMASSIGGAGVWAEAALFKLEEDVIMSNDFTPMFPGSPFSMVVDSVLIEKSEPYLKYIVGGDYFFGDGSYLNLQYMHGFIHERGNSNLNDYFFMQFEKPFLNQKLKIAPLGGGFIVNDWDNLKDNYALIYMPSITYQATPNAEILISLVIFKGTGSNIFADLEDYDLLMFKFKYSF